MFRPRRIQLPLDDSEANIEPGISGLDQDDAVSESEWEVDSQPLTNLPPSKAFKGKQVIRMEAEPWGDSPWDSRTGGTFIMDIQQRVSGKVSQRL